MLKIGGCQKNLCARDSDTFYPGFQYLISSVCQIWVMNIKFNQNVEFNIHFFKLLFVFKAKVYFSIEYLI